MCMAGQSSLYGAILAFSVVFAGFSVLCVWTPAGVPLGAVWGHGLVQDVVFERDYKALEIVRAGLVYRNPSDSAVSFYLYYPVSYSVYVDGVFDRSGGEGVEGEWKIVTVPAGGEVAVNHVDFQPEAAGWYEVEWGGVRRGIEVAPCDAVARIVTDKEWYEEGENGHATLEYYNARTYNVTIGLPSRVRFASVYPDGKRDSVDGGFIDWAYASRTLAPGEVLRVTEFYFKTSRAGSFMLEGMGAKATVCVLPASP